MYISCRMSPTRRGSFILFEPALMVIFLDITKVLSGYALGLTRGTLPPNKEVRLVFGPTLDPFPVVWCCKDREKELCIKMEQVYVGEKEDSNIANQNEMLESKGRLIQKNQQLLYILAMVYITNMRRVLFNN